MSGAPKTVEQEQAERRQRDEEARKAKLQARKDEYAARTERRKALKKMRGKSAKYVKSHEKDLPAARKLLEAAMARQREEQEKQKNLKAFRSLQSGIRAKIAKASAIRDLHLDFHVAETVRMCFAGGVNTSSGGLCRTAFQRWSRDDGISYGNHKP